MESRIIKFRAWDKKMSTMHDLVGFLIFKEFTEIHFGTSGFKKLRPDEVELLAFTGLKDKNGLGNTCFYEGDIVDLSGKLIGNKYETPEILKDKTNLLIEGIGTKNWRATEDEALGRGLGYPQ